MRNLGEKTCALDKPPCRKLDKRISAALRMRTHSLRNSRNCQNRSRVGGTRLFTTGRGSQPVTGQVVNPSLARAEVGELVRVASELGSHRGLQPVTGPRSHEFGHCLLSVTATLAIWIETQKNGRKGKTS